MAKRRLARGGASSNIFTMPMLTAPRADLPIHGPIVRLPRVSRFLAGCFAMLLAAAIPGGARADLIGHGGMVRAVDVSPDGHWVVTASFDFTARLWDFGTQAEVAVLDAHEGPVTSAVFTPDGKHAVTTSDDKSAIIWNVPSGKLVRRLTGHGHKVMAAAVSPDGQQIATGSWDKTLRIWDMATGEAIRVITHSAPINDVAFVNGGAWVAAGGHDGKVGMWSIKDGRLQGVLEGHRQGITKMNALPGGKRLLTASIDRTLRLWDVKTGEAVSVLTHSEDRTGQVYAAAVSPDGLYTKCANCHALNAQAATRSGPHFEGLWGRRVGAVEGYNYSGALRNKSFTWNEKTLFDLFYQGPDKFLPGTKMPVQQVPDKEQLANLVDYLRVLTTGGAKQ